MLLIAIDTELKIKLASDSFLTKLFDLVGEMTRNLVKPYHWAREGVGMSPTTSGDLKSFVRLKSSAMDFGGKLAEISSLDGLVSVSGNAFCLTGAI